MKIQIHAHTRRYSQCAAFTPAQQVSAHIEAGYGVLYITEHDRVWNDWELEDLRQQYQNIAIMPGVELSMMDGAEHLLVLGGNDEEYLTMRQDVAAVLDRARKRGHLTVLAHPYRWATGAEMLDRGLLPDAIEYCTPNHDPAGSSKALETAQRLGLPLLNAGDVHGQDMVDRFWIETNVAPQDPADIRGIVLAGNYRNACK
jgi:predicted metal-dependent phosphoesterase TrpH